VAAADQQGTDQILRPGGAGGAAKALPDGAVAGEEEDTISLQVLISRAAGLPKADFLGTADPYVELRVVSGDPLNGTDFKPQELRKQKSKALESKTVFQARTKVIRGTLDPVWGERFTFSVPKSKVAASLFLYFRVYDHDHVRSDDFLGHVSVGLLDALVSSRKLSAGWRALLRQSLDARERLQLLQDQRLPAQPARAYSVKPVPGQEDTYDLSQAQLVVALDFLSGLAPAMGRRAGSVGRASPQGDAARAELDAELLCAAVEGDVPRLHGLLGHGAQANACASDGEFRGCALLHIACLRGHGDLAKVLVDVFDASLVQPAPGGRSAAMCACEANEGALAQWLISEGVPADLEDDAGRTVLFYAAQAALPQLTGWLVAKQHLPPGGRAADGSTPLAAAAGSGLSNASLVVQRLLDAKASANQADREGNTPLHAACEAGDDQCVQLLLGPGRARTDTVDAQGRSPAELARLSNMPSATVRKLISSSGASAAEDGGGRQQPGETVREAEKRELREQKAKLSNESSWRTWRSMHPRSGLQADTGAGISGLQTRKAATPVDEPEDEFFADSVRTWTAGNEIPRFVGRATPPAEGKEKEAAGRLNRFKNWAMNLRRRSASPGPPERQDSWSSIASASDMRF